MTTRFHLNDLTDTALDLLAAGLRSWLLSPDSQVEGGREDLLKEAIRQITTDQGPDSHAFALAHWCLQVHHLQQTRASRLDSVAAIPLCDLERIQELAMLLRLSGIADEVQSLRTQAADSAGAATPFRVASGGFDTLPEVLEATVEALRQRLEVLTGSEANAEGMDTSTRVLQLLADRDFISRHLVNGSQDRLAQCQALATMVLVMREFERLDIVPSRHCEVADALRLAQLGEIAGITPIRQGQAGTPDSKPEDPADMPAPPEPAEPAAPDSEAEGLTIDLDTSGTAVPAMEEDPGVPPEPVPDDMPEAETAIPETPTAALPVPEETSVPAAGVIPMEEELPPVEDRARSGLSQMLLMLLLALAAIALLILFVVQPPVLGPDAAWRQTLSNLIRRTTPAAVVQAEPTPEVAATPILAATATPEPTPTLPPTATPASPTPTPEPTLDLSDIVTAEIALVLYAWPNLKAEKLGTVNPGEVVVPIVQIMTETETWLRLENTYFVLAEAVNNVPTNLPVQTLAELEGMPDFAVAAPVETPAAPPETSPPPPPAGPITTRTVRMRAGPGETHEDKGRLEAGLAVEPIGTNSRGDWLVLTNRYWIPVTAVSQMPDGLAVMTAPYAAVDSNLREAPTTQSAIGDTIKAGGTLVLTGQKEGYDPDGTWYRLDSGLWIYGPLVTAVPADLPVLD